MCPLPASCANATLQLCRIGARCARWCAIGLPGRFTTGMVVNHAVPGRAKSSARGAPPCAQAMSGTGWWVSDRLACTGQAAGP